MASFVEKIINISGSTYVEGRDSDFTGGSPETHGLFRITGTSLSDTLNGGNYDDTIRGEGSREYEGQQDPHGLAL